MNSLPVGTFQSIQGFIETFSGKVLLIDRFDINSYNMYFTFEFTQMKNGEIRVYIKGAPGYGNQPTSGHETHRYFDKLNRPYICFDPAPKNLLDAKIIAHQWAIRTAYYIRYGEWKNV
jgi:hypothetical protein